MIKDKIGQNIEPGCIIVYGHAAAYSNCLRIGKVIKAEQFKKTYHYYNGDVIRDFYKITVHSIDDDYCEPKLLEKRSVLQFPNRIVVLKREQVKKELLDLLDKVNLWNGF